MSDDRPIFVLHLQPNPGIDATLALRRLLKLALRVCGLRCVRVAASAAIEDDATAKK